MTVKSKKSRSNKAIQPDRSKRAAGGKASIAREGSKLEKILSLLRSKEGATLDQLAKATGWQPHSVRGVMSGTVKKKMGLPIVSEKSEGVRIYKIQQPAGN